MNIKRALQRVGILAAFCLAPLANADTLQYVGGGVNPGFGSFYVGPYQVKINGAAAVAGICDDFTGRIPGPPSTWTAERHDLTEAGLAGARYISQGVQKYFQVAYLSQKLLAATTNQQRGFIQYAIWAIFNPVALSTIGAYGGVSTTDPCEAGVEAYICEAVANATAADGIGWSVYTPFGTPDSQEFLVRTPETSAVLLLAFNLSALLGVVFLLRRRITNV